MSVIGEVPKFPQMPGWRSAERWPGRRRSTPNFLRDAKVFLAYSMSKMTLVSGA